VADGKKITTRTLASIDGDGKMLAIYSKSLFN
jgi:hypothetical protein